MKKLFEIIAMLVGMVMIVGLVTPVTAQLMPGKVYTLPGYSPCPGESIFTPAPVWGNPVHLFHPEAGTNGRYGRWCEETTAEGRATQKGWTDSTRVVHMVYEYTMPSDPPAQLEILVEYEDLKFGAFGGPAPCAIIFYEYWEGGSRDYFVTNDFDSPKSFEFSPDPRSWGKRVHSSVSIFRLTNDTTVACTVVADRTLQLEAIGIAVSSETDDRPGLSQVGQPYPNPAKAGQTVRLPAPYGARMTVTDVLGRVVLAVPQGLPGQLVEVPTWGLAPGRYFIRVEAPSGVETRMMVVR